MLPWLVGHSGFGIRDRLPAALPLEPLRVWCRSVFGWGQEKMHRVQVIMRGREGLMYRWSTMTFQFGVGCCMGMRRLTTGSRMWAFRGLACGGRKKLMPCVQPAGRRADRQCLLGALLPRARHPAGRPDAIRQDDPGPQRGEGGVFRGFAGGFQCFHVSSKGLLSQL